MAPFVFFVFRNRFRLCLIFQTSQYFIPVGTIGVQRVILSSPFKQFVHIVVYILHTPDTSLSLFFTIFCKITLAFDKLDLEVPTEMPNKLAISWWVRPS